MVVVQQVLGFHEAAAQPVHLQYPRRQPAHELEAQVVALSHTASRSCVVRIDNQVRKTPSWRRSWANFSLL